MTAAFALAVVAIALPGCGGDQVATTAEPQTTLATTTTVASTEAAGVAATTEAVVQDEEPDTCADLAEAFVDSAQRVLDATALADAEAEQQAALTAHAELMSEVFSTQADELCSGGFAEFDALRCERTSNLVLSGEPGQQSLAEIEDVFPPCE